MPHLNPPTSVEETNPSAHVVFLDVSLEGLCLLRHLCITRRTENLARARRCPLTFPLTSTSRLLGSRPLVHTLGSHRRQTVTAGLAALEARAGVGPNHPDVAELCMELGRIHIEDESLKKAVYHFERAWRIFREVRGKTAPETLLAQEELAMALHRAGEHMRADALLNAAMEGMKTVTKRHNRSIFAEEKARREQERLKKMMDRRGSLGIPSSATPAAAGVESKGKNLWQRAVGNVKTASAFTSRGLVAGAGASTSTGGGGGNKRGGGMRNMWQKAAGKARIVSSWGPPPPKKNNAAVPGNNKVPPRVSSASTSSKAGRHEGLGGERAKPRLSSAFTGSKGGGGGGEVAGGGGLMARLREVGLTGGGASKVPEVKASGAASASTPKPTEGQGGKGPAAAMAALMGGKPPATPASVAAPKSGLLAAVLSSAGEVKSGSQAPDKDADPNKGAGTPPPQSGENMSPLAPQVSWSPGLGGSGTNPSSSQVAGGTSPFKSPAAKARLPSNTTRTSELTDAARLATAATAVGAAAETSSAHKKNPSYVVIDAGRDDVHSPMAGIAAAAKAATAVKKATNAWRALKQSKAAIKKQEEEEFRYKAASAEATRKGKAFQDAVQDAGNREDNFHIENKVMRLPSRKNLSFKVEAMVDVDAPSGLDRH